MMYSFCKFPVNLSHLVNARVAMLNGYVAWCTTIIYIVKGYQVMRQGLLFVSILIGSHCLRAQDYPSLARHLPEVEGTVYALLQDSKGFMWFGTSAGLLRYDGFSYTRYIHQPNDTLSLSDSFVTAIAEDSESYLWVLTLNGGVNRFNPAMGTAVTLDKIIGNEQIKNEKSFYAVAIDSAGHIWLGGKALYRIQMPQLTVDIFQPPVSSVSEIFFSKKNTLWLGSNGDGFGTYYPESNRYDAVMLQHPDALVQERMWVIRSLTEDNRGRIWAGTYGGLVCLDPATKKVQHYTHNPQQPESLPHNSIWNAKAAPNGTVWISTWGGGVTRFDPVRETFQNDLFRAGGLCYIPATQVPGMGLTANGTLWLGTNGRGIYQLRLPENLRAHPLPFTVSSAVTRIIQLKRWTTIITSDSGTYLYDSVTHTFHHLPYARQGGKTALAGNRVAAVTERNNGKIYLATENGLTEFNPLTGSTRHLRKEEQNANSLNHNDVQTLLTDNDDRLWLGTPFGISYLNNDEKTFTWLKEPRTSVVELAGAGEFILAGTTTEGLFIINKATNTIRHYDHTNGITNNYITALLYDIRGDIWIGTNQGLIQMSRNFDRLQPIEIFNTSRINRLQAGNDGILVYSNQHFYHIRYGTVKGVMLPKSITGSYLPLYWEDTDRLALIASGYLYSLPLRSAPPKNKIPLIISGLTVLGGNVQAISAATMHPAYRTSLVLPHNQNFFSLEFALLDFAPPGSHQYAYRLEGLDPEWNLSTNRRYATYTNVAPGTYAFKLKALSLDQQWHESSQVLKIVILPPWYKTWWAYIAYTLGAAGLLWMARKNIIHRERLKAQVALEQKEKQTLHELDRLKSKFFSNITHEFRTPLTLIQGPVDNLLEKTSDRNTLRQLQLIKSNSQRLLRLINQLLDLAKLDANEIRLDLQPTNLAEVARNTLSQFTSLAELRHISFQWQLTEPVPTVMADAEKVETILNNLLSNALKFTPAGGSVKVFTQFHNNAFTFNVEDTGRGIPADQLPHIFDRFYQVAASDSSHAEGTGIGLALVKEYVELMNGIIRVESTPGKGTTFNVTLPFVPATQAVADKLRAVEAVAEASATSEHESAWQVPLVLIVDDNRDIRSLIKTCLGPGYRYTEAPNGKEGLEKARHEIPDVIISDLMMPEMDGLEFCERIKKDAYTNHIPFIMLTAKAAEEHKLSGLQTGADDYLVKPFHKQELIYKVQNLVSLREKLQQHIKLNLLSQATPVKAVSASEQFILKAKNFIETHLADNKLSVEALAAELNLGREQCYRKLMALTGLSPSAFIRKIRLQRAAQLLAARWGPVSQVAYEVGYENLSHFSKAFKEEFGKLPSEYASGQL